MMTYLNFPKKSGNILCHCTLGIRFCFQDNRFPSLTVFYFLLGAASIALIVYLTLVSTRVEIQNTPYFHSYSSINNHEGTI